LRFRFCHFFASPGPKTEKFPYPLTILSQSTFWFSCMGIHLRGILMQISTPNFPFIYFKPRWNFPQTYGVFVVFLGLGTKRVDFHFWHSDLGVLVSFGADYF
jgi:hypothetical protein